MVGSCLFLVGLTCIETLPIDSMLFENVWNPIDFFDFNIELNDCCRLSNNLQWVGD